MARYVVLREIKGWTPWVEPVEQRGHLNACCDCHAVHRMQFRIVVSKATGRPAVQFRVRRAPRLTARRRRQKRR